MGAVTGGATNNHQNQQLTAARQLTIDPEESPPHTSPTSTPAIATNSPRSRTAIAASCCMAGRQVRGSETFRALPAESVEEVLRAMLLVDVSASQSVSDHH